MSGTLKINFSTDMPQASVEVVSPKLETVGRLWLRPGRSGSIDVPSEGSFLRVHLASGEVVTLKDPGNFDRLIQWSDLSSELESRATGAPSSLSKMMRVHASSAVFTPVVNPLASIDLGHQLTARLVASGDDVRSAVSTEGTAFRLTPDSSHDGYDLLIERPGFKARIRMPGLLRDFAMQVEPRGSDRQVVMIRVRTKNPTADAISAYMTRGDLYSASAMADWIEEAQDLLLGKLEDPFSAAVGGYLLLRLRSLPQLRTWARNLADNFPQMADGSIIWAWQQILLHGDENEIRAYLKRAVSADLPVYTEGLRLLRDALSMLGHNAQSDSKTLQEMAGEVIWSSPLTACITRTSGPLGAVGQQTVELDVDYATTAL